MKSLYHFLYSEATAQPFCHELVFMKAIHSPKQLLAKDIYPKLESDLIRLIPGISVDHIANIRDQVWFQGDPTTSGLLQILRNHAKKYLRPVGYCAYPDLVGDEKSMSDIWRWITFALPPDLLLAAGWEQDGPLEISWKTPILKNHLRDHGIAQTHVHLGAAGEFSFHWCQIQNALRTQTDAHKLADKGAPFEDGTHFLSWLTASGFSRMLICEYLFDDSPKKVFEDFFQLVLHKIATKISPDESIVFFEAIHAIASPKQQSLPKYQRLQNLYARLTDFQLPILESQDIWLLDPLVRTFSAKPDDRDKFEIIWLRKAFEYIESSIGQNDELFQRLLWQTIRVKVMYYRYIVQRPMVKGLSWFINFYRRIGKLMHSKFALEQAFLLEGGKNHSLRSYEYRTAPAEKFTRNRKELLSTIESWLKFSERGNAEIGCVLHIPKARGPVPKINKTSQHWQDTWLNPENNVKNYRLGGYYKTKIGQIKSFCRILTEIPLSLAFVRGFDMCTDEIGVPNWFMSFLFSPLKEAGMVAHQKVNQQYPEWKIEPFKRTMHVGEDFHHLLDGIRRMDEVITRLPLEHGDRIGHGLALGLSPKRWCEQHPIVWMPKEIRLWDLIWEWRQYIHSQTNIYQSRLEKIKYQISQYSQDIFGSGCTAQDTFALYDDLFNTNMLHQVGFPNGENVMANLSQVTPQNRRWYWLLTYLTDIRCFEAGYQIIEVHNTPDETEALYTMQRSVRQRVCQKEITIEVNPSSNFLIADLQNLEFHPLWNLNPPPEHQLDTEMGPPVNICIGSDDPITFATNLPQEYELLYNILLQKGVGSVQALQWLDQVRQTGLNARFTLSFGQNNRDADDVWQQLLQDLKLDWKPQEILT